MNDTIVIDEAIVWWWDAFLTAWRRKRSDGGEYVVVGDGLNVVPAIIELSAASQERANVLFYVGGLVWGYSDSNALSATTDDGWFVTVTEQPEGWLVSAAGYGEAETYLRKIHLRDALYEASQWSRNLWKSEIEDASGRVWKWDKVMEAYVLKDGGQRYEVFQRRGLWRVRKVGVREYGGLGDYMPIFAIERARLLE